MEVAILLRIVVSTTKPCLRWVGNGGTTMFIVVIRRHLVSNLKAGTHVLKSEFAWFPLDQKKFVKRLEMLDAVPLPT
jgi:hypothetical protein